MSSPFRNIESDEDPLPLDMNLNEASQHIQELLNYIPDEYQEMEVNEKEKNPENKKNDEDDEDVIMAITAKTNERLLNSLCESLSISSYTPLMPEDFATTALLLGPNLELELQLMAHSVPAVSDLSVDEVKRQLQLDRGDIMRTVWHRWRFEIDPLLETPTEWWYSNTNGLLPALCPASFWAHRFSIIRARTIFAMTRNEYSEAHEYDPDDSYESDREQEEAVTVEPDVGAIAMFLEGRQGEVMDWDRRYRDEIAEPLPLYAEEDNGEALPAYTPRGDPPSYVEYPLDSLPYNSPSVRRYRFEKGRRRNENTCARSRRAIREGKKRAYLNAGN